MTRPFVLCVASLLVAPAASAQYGPQHDFTSLMPGNRWEYVFTNHLVTPPVVAKRLVTTVDSEIMIDGSLYSVLTAQSFAPDGTPTSVRNTCAYSVQRNAVAPSGSTTLPDYSCTPDMPFPLYCSSCERSGPTTVLVSGQAVRFDSLHTNRTNTVGTSGQFYNGSNTSAYNFGRISVREESRRRNFDLSYTETSMWQDLTYARVANVEYGRAVVAGEAEATPGAVFDVIASPNPSAGIFRIDARIASGRVIVDVFDALGRRVDGGTVQGDAAFTFRAPAAGVYVVRARDEAGRTAVRRVVRR